MMIRGILLGSIAFGTVFLLERDLGTALVDMRRYDKLRAMSGDSSVLTETFKRIGAYLLRSNRQPDDGKNGLAFFLGPDETAGRPKTVDGPSLFGTVLSDALRYVSMRAM